jgi:DNA primase
VRGDEAVRVLIASRKPMFEFMIRRQLAGNDLETVEGRVAALRAAAPVVAGIRDRSMSVGYVRSLAGWLGLEPDEVGRAVAAARAAIGRTPAPRAPSPSPDRTAAEAPSRPPEIRMTDLPRDPVTRGESEALMAMLQHPEAVGHELMSRATQAQFSNSTLAVIRDGIAASIDQASGPNWLSRVTEQVPTAFATLVTQLGVAPIPARAEQLDAYCEGIVIGLVDRDLLRRKAELLGAMHRAKGDGDTSRWDDLHRQEVALELERRQVRKE